MVEIISQIADIDSKLNMKLKNVDTNDFSKSQNLLKELRILLTEYNKKISELDNEIQMSDEQNLFNELKNFNNEYGIKKNKVDKLEKMITQIANNQKFQRGELKGQNLRNAERDAIKDLHKETDVQGDIITEIGKDINSANTDLKDAIIETKKQGEQIVNIHEGVNQASSTVKRTDQNISQMTRKALLMKFLMIVLVTVLFLLDVALLIWKLWPKS